MRREGPAHHPPEPARVCCCFPFKGAHQLPALPSPSLSCQLLSPARPLSPSLRSQPWPVLERGPVLPPPCSSQVIGGCGETREPYLNPPIRQGPECSLLGPLTEESGARSLEPGHPLLCLLPGTLLSFHCCLISDALPTGERDFSLLPPPNRALPLDP